MPKCEKCHHDENDHLGDHCCVEVNGELCDCDG